MSYELNFASFVRQVIAEAWNDPAWKEQLKTKGNVLPLLKERGIELPYELERYSPDIRVVECIPGTISYIVLPPKPQATKGHPGAAIDDLAMVAARGNTVLGI